MTDDDEHGEDSADDEGGADARRKRIERERTELIKSVTAEDFSTLKSRVAAILNLYPAARDSDIVLSLRYWATFQPDLYNPAGIRPVDLFKLERETTT